MPPGTLHDREAAPCPRSASCSRRATSTTLGAVAQRLAPGRPRGRGRRLDRPRQVHILRVLQPALASRAFEYLDLETQHRLLDDMTPAESAAILDGMAPDDRTALLEELAPRAGRAAHRPARLPSSGRSPSRCCSTAEDSVGRLMTPDYVAVRKDWTIQHVLDHVRSHGRDSETLNVIYVVDDDEPADRRPADPRDPAGPAPQPRRATSATTSSSRLKATDDKKTAVEVFRKYDRTALPVVDATGGWSGS